MAFFYYNTISKTFLDQKTYLKAIECIKSYTWEAASEEDIFPKEMKCYELGIFAIKLAKDDPIMYIFNSKINDYEVLLFSKDEMLIRNIIE